MPPAPLLAGVAGLIYASNIKAADANAAGQFIELYAILAVVLGGTSLMGGKFSLAGTVVGVLDPPNPRVLDPFPRGTVGAEPGVLRDRRRRSWWSSSRRRLHRFVRRLTQSMRSRGATEDSPDDAEVLGMTSLDSTVATQPTLSGRYRDFHEPPRSLLCRRLRQSPS